MYDLNDCNAFRAPYNSVNGAASALRAQRCSGLGCGHGSDAKCISTSRGSRKRTACRRGPSPVGKSISTSDRGLDALDGGLSSMLENYSGKLLIVERELMRFHQRQDVRPVFFGIVTPELPGRVQLQGNQRLYTRRGNRLGIRFRARQYLKHLIIHQHQIDRRERELVRSFELMEIGRFGENPISQIRKDIPPSPCRRPRNEQIEIKCRTGMPESGHRMPPNHQGRQILFLDLFGNRCQQAFHRLIDTVERV